MARAYSSSVWLVESTKISPIWVVVFCARLPSLEGGCSNSTWVLSTMATRYGMFGLFVVDNIVYIGTVHNSNNMACVICV